MRLTAAERQLGSILQRFGWLVSVMLLGFVALFSWQTWLVVKRDRLTELKSVVELGEKTVDLYFGKMGLALQNLSLQLVDAGPLTDPKRSHLLLKRFHQSHSELLNVKLTRPDGAVLLSAIQEPELTPHGLDEVPASMAIPATKHSESAVQLGRPLSSQLLKTWFVPLSYEIKDTSGRLTYILMAQFPVDLLQTFWREAPITRIATMGLVRDDGFVLSQFPQSNFGALDQVYGKPTQGGLIAQLKSNEFPVKGSFEGPGSLGSAQLMQAYRRLQNFPMTLFVSVPLTQIQAAWWRQVQLPYVLLSLLYIGGWAVYRVTRRRQHAWSLEQKRVEEGKIQQTYFDSLTGLPNRRLLMDRLDQVLKSARRMDLVSSLMVLDLDHFKSLNESHGHAVGDGFLRAMSQRLTDSLREMDTVAHLGGDKFVLLISGQSMDLTAGALQAHDVANKILGLVVQPLTLEGMPCICSCSIGVKLVSAQALSSRELLRDADTAMYRAKISGRNRIVFFDTAADLPIQLAQEDQQAAMT
ncbi:MAG: diguanylate cyclase [Burkholderiaceae bacterium]